MAGIPGPTRVSSSPLNRSALLGAGGACAVILAIYVLRLNSVMGQMIDDAWYVVLGKSLAEGTGFRLISSATIPIQPLYPPGFPAILALVFRFGPGFPENIWLLKSVSIASMMGAGLLTSIYLNRHRQLSKELAALVAIAVTITPALVFLATSTIMSECVFMLSQLATIVMVHRSAEAAHERAGLKFAVLAGVLAASAMLIRSAAISVILAAVLWLLKERLWRRAAWFSVAAVLCVLPWTLYGSMHASTGRERAEHGGAVVYPYLDQLSMRWAGAPAFGRITVAELPARIQTNVVDVFTRGVGGILVPILLRSPGESGEEVVALVPPAGISVPSMGGIRETTIISVLLSAVAFAGFFRSARERWTVAEVYVPIALAVIVLWPYPTFRFVLPLTPFLLFYFVNGLRAVAPRAAPLALLSIVGLNLVDHAAYIWHARTDGSVGWKEQARDVDDLLGWINRGGLPDNGLLVTTNPGLVYLRTGRKSIASDHLKMDWDRWRQQGVRYVAALYPIELPDASHGEFKVLYHSAADLWVIEI